jgi:hypothetical protein
VAEGNKDTIFTTTLCRGTVNGVPDLSERVTGWLLDRWPWGAPVLAAAGALAGGGVLLVTGSDDLGVAILSMFVLLVVVVVLTTRPARRAQGDGASTHDVVQVMAYVDRGQGRLPEELRPTAVRDAEGQRDHLRPAA